jgi:hypothetical protein
VIWYVAWLLNDVQKTKDEPKANWSHAQHRVLTAALSVWGQAGRKHTIPITGRSMLPLIQDGDHVQVTHDLSDVQRGDVVVFQQGGKLIAHRVLHMRKEGSEALCITKGDSVPCFDAPVRAHEIIGRVVAVSRGNRCVSLDTPAWRKLGWLIAVGTLPGATLYSWARTQKRHLRGSLPYRATRLLHWSILAPTWLSLKVIQSITKWLHK